MPSIRFASLSFATALLGLTACGGPLSDTPSDAPPSPETIETAARAQLTPFPLCEDLEIHFQQAQICPLVWCEPFDSGPATTYCERTCTTERNLVWTGPALPPGSGPTFECQTGETECTPWDCDPCPTDC